MDITSAECVFIAENTHVTIAPEFDHPQLKLLSVGDVSHHMTTSTRQP
jgi:hypothetical protein